MLYGGSPALKALTDLLYFQFLYLPSHICIVEFMKKATFIPVQGEARIVELSDDYEVSSRQINELVGGWFDCVSIPQLGIVIYVHDEGLLLGMNANVTASTLSNRVLVGDVLICGSLNSEGEYDGETYDVPEHFMSQEFLFTSEFANGVEFLIDDLNRLRQQVLEGTGVYIMDNDQYMRTLDTHTANPMFN